MGIDDRARLLLWPDVPPFDEGGDGFRPYLVPHLPSPAESSESLGAVIVCPGGGYQTRAPHETDPIAERFNEYGIPAFVLHYRVAPNRHPAPISDVARAIRLVRHRADSFGINRARIAVLGFSAGGHLAASIGVHHASVPVRGDADEIDHVSARPDALLLCYAVITAGEHGHGGSLKNLLGPAATDSDFAFMSLERHVSEDTPPTFLWHTVEDQAVPVENALLFAASLRKVGVPFEIHVYPCGVHGLGLSPADAHVATWFDLGVGWLRDMGW